jgi:hypothetical protein
MSKESAIKDAPIEDTKLTVEIKNTRPIELLDLTDSLLSLGEEYKRFIAANPEHAETQGLKLYIKEIRTGSVITDLVAMAASVYPVALPFISDTNNLIEFSKYLKSAYGYLTGKSNERVQLQKQDYTNLSKIVEPVAKDNGSQMNFSTVVNGNVINNFYINSTEANAAQNTARREIEQFREPETRVHNQVVLYWYRASRDTDKQVGDRAIIESISPSPVKTVFENEKTKAEMILSDPNPFLSAYVVDVFVDTIKGKPALYKIIHLHDRIDKPE